MLQKSRLLCWTLIGVWATLPAWGDPKTSDNAAFIRKAQGMIRQLTQEKTALQAEKNAWQQEKNELGQRLKRLESEVTALQPLQGEVERYKAGLEQIQNQFQSRMSLAQQRQQALLKKYNALADQARNLIADNELLLNATQEREQWIQQCTEHNQQLVDAQRQLIEQYQDKSLFRRMLELEPFTGIAHVATHAENRGNGALAK